MSRPTYRVHFVRHHDGALTGRLLRKSGWEPQPISGYGRTDDEVFSQLALAIEEMKETPQPYRWTEPLELRRVRVRVHPQAIVKKRHVIAAQEVELTLAYFSHRLPDGGVQIIVPRFDWSFVTETLDMAAEILSQAVSTALLGEQPRSLADFRGSSDERVVPWAPTLSRRTEEGREDEDEDDMPVLHAIAEDLAERDRRPPQRPIVGDLELDAHLPLVLGEHPRSLLVIGPSGCGKTTWVRALARRLAREAQGAAPRVWHTSADRIVSGMKYLGQWEQRCLDLVEELSGDVDYLYVDQLAPLCAPQSGRTSIADMFAPAMQNGELRLIAECTPEELQRLAARHPAFIERFARVRIDPPATAVMPALLAAYQRKRNPAVTIHGPSWRTLVQHLEFFERSRAFPGKGFRFLDWLAQQTPPESAETPTTLEPHDISEAFARSCGLPLELVSERKLASRDTIAARLREGVIGQDEACLTTARVLTRFKTGLVDPQRPIGSLFFVGPTGVGKTELAKQLTRYMFGTADAMVRLDMSEYMLPGAAQRLLEVGAGVRSLVERVRQRPLSVVLLDEIEKAHVEVFDLLLAMLGEGRMTDVQGRLVDFRMTLIVMTSNLGVRERGAPGFGADDSSTHDLLAAVRDHFRPEFFNRIDHVVPFRRLSPEDIAKVVVLELRQLSRRAGLKRRGLTLQVSTRASEALARAGWHPTRGARPLKRVLEAWVMTPLAVRLAAEPGLSGQVVRVVVPGETARQGDIVLPNE